MTIAGLAEAGPDLPGGLVRGLNPANGGTAARSTRCGEPRRLSPVGGRPPICHHALPRHSKAHQLDAEALAPGLHRQHVVVEQGLFFRTDCE
jgi:hypothetical protein